MLQYYEKKKKNNNLLIFLFFTCRKTAVYSHALASPRNVICRSRRQQNQISTKNEKKKNINKI